jgi:hypothetical protein
VVDDSSRWRDGSGVVAPPPAMPPLPGAQPEAPPSSPRRRRRGLWLAGALVLVVVVVGTWLGIRLGTGGSGTGASSARQAAGLLRSSLAAAETAGSFHYQSSSTSSSPTNPVTQLTVGDAGASQGTQVITISGHSFDVLVAGPTAYFKGDAFSTADSLDVPDTVAEACAGKWISLVSGDSPYRSVEVAVTTSSALEENVAFRARSELGPSSTGGVEVMGLRGPLTPVDGQHARGTATLFVTAGGRHLPVRYVEQGTLGSGADATRLAFSMSFSSWGEPVRVTAPSGAVPFSSLGVQGGAGAPGPSGPTLLTGAARLTGTARLAVAAGPRLAGSE